MTQLAVLNGLLETATVAVSLKRQLLKREMELTVCKDVHLKQFESVEKELIKALKPVFELQVKEAMAEPGKVLNKKKWKKRILKAAAPALIRGAAEAAKSQLMLMGVRRKSFELWEKFNPHHDHLGRFARGSGSLGDGPVLGIGDPVGTTEKEVIEYARNLVLGFNDDAEHLIALDSTGRVIGISHGDPGAEAVDSVRISELHQRGSMISEHHNHPFDTPPSLGDILHLADNEGISEIFAHSKETSYRVKPVGEDRRALYFAAKDVHADVRNRLLDEFMDAGKLDPAHRQEFYQQIGFAFMKELSDRGLVEYSVERKQDQKSTFFQTKASTATEYLLNQGLELPNNFLTEFPKVMQDRITGLLAESFDQDYWEEMTQTTQDDIERVIKAGVNSGVSIADLARQIDTLLGEDAYYHRRAENIARTEAGNALNGARKVAMEETLDGLPPELGARPTWLSVLGNTTRDSHANLDGVPAGKDGMWTLGGVRIPWPGHISLPPGERCFCRCTIVVSWGMDEGEARGLIADHFDRMMEEERSFASELWEKFNPHHDHLGRFATHGGVGGIGVQEATGKQHLSSDAVKTVEDLKEFASVLIGPELFTHAVRYDSYIDSVLENGIQPGKNGKVSTTSTMVKTGGQIDKYGVRDIGSGYVVIDGTGLKRNEKVDVVSSTEKYPEMEFLEAIPPERIRKVVRMVTDSTGFTIREDHLADYAAKNQGLTGSEVDSLPEKYRKWFHLIEQQKNFTLQTKFNPHHDHLGRFARARGSGMAETEVHEVKTLGGANGLKILESKELGGGINKSLLVDYVDKDGTARKAVFKPTKGTRGRTGFEAETIAAREVAASVIDQEMGLGMVGKVEHANLEGYGAGSLHEWVNTGATPAISIFAAAEVAVGTTGKTQAEFDDEVNSKVIPQFDKVSNIRDMQYFDAITGNVDRHMGNWLIKDGQAKLIDHGYSLASNDHYTRNTWDRFRTMEKMPKYQAPSPMSPKFKEGLNKILKNKEQVDAKLKKAGLPDADRESFWKRAEYLTKVPMLGFGPSLLTELAANSEGVAPWDM